MKTRLLQLITFIILTGYLQANENSFTGINNDALTKAIANKAFIENKGQWDNNILFSADINGITVAITNDGIVYDYHTVNSTYDKQNRKGHVVIMEFAGAAINSSAISGNQPAGVTNYFIGNKCTDWVTNARQFKSVTIGNIYPGVDVLLMLADGKPRYDFLIQPGVDPSKIKLNFRGADYSNITAKGDVAVGTQLGEMLHGNVFAYQTVGGKKTEVACKFVKKGDKIGFALGKYNKSLPLIIDPVVYASYWGGSGKEEIKTMEMIGYNSFIICGNTESTDLKTTPGAYDEYYDDYQDAFISKFTFEGTEIKLDFSTFFGTLEFDEVAGMGLDENFNIFVAGCTKSDQFPNENAYMRDFNGVIDGFITKFNSDANQIIYSTYIGGSKEDKIHAMTINAKGNVYIVGETSSSNFPIEAGAYQNKKKALNDIFAAKFNTNGTNLDWSTYLGGNNEDKGYGISVDQEGKAYITGTTNSEDFPVVPYLEWWTYLLESPYDKSYNGGWDAFVACIREGSIVYSTFFGGTGDDIGRAVLAENDNTCFVAGETTGGTGFPVSDNAYQATNKGGKDGFFAKLDKVIAYKQWGYDYKSQALKFSTFFGGSGADSVGLMKRHPLNNTIMIMGSTKSNNFPVTGDETAYLAGNEGFLTEFGQTGAAIVTSRLFTGNGNETINGMGLDNLGNYIIAGTTTTQNLTTTTNAAQGVYGGGVSDGFIYKSVNVNISIASPIGSEALCTGTDTDIKWVTEGIPESDKITIEIRRNIEGAEWTTITNNASNKSFRWTIPNDFIAANDYIIRVSHSSGVSSQSVENFAILPKPVLNWIKSNPEKLSFCPGETIEFTSSATGNDLKYQWYYNDVMLMDQTNPTFVIDTVTADHKGSYKLVVSDKCPPSLTSEVITINVLPETKITLQPSDTTLREEETIELKIDAEGSNLSFEWYKDDMKLIGETGKTVKIQSAVITDEGDYYCKVTGDCGTVDSEIAKVKVDTSENSVHYGEGYSDNGFRISAHTQNNGNVIKVKINSENECKTNIKLVDIFGSVVYEMHDLNIQPGTNDFAIQSEMLSSGVYWLTGECGALRSIMKVLIAK